LNIDVNSTLSHLKGAINRWEEFRDACTRMEQWLTTSEQQLTDYPQSKGEVGEMKTLMERLKSQQMEFERKKADLDHLRREASELSTWANDQSCTNVVDQLHEKWGKLSIVTANYHSRLEEEIMDYNAYHQALQDTEKWILQTSFHLMAHNSMYITTRDQTEEQTKKHNVRNIIILAVKPE
jgi:nesprin-1